jgi:hypothetical protein
VIAAEGGRLTAAPALVGHYETLRSEVLAHRSHGSHLGLVVVLREGLAAWMAAWATCPPAVAARAVCQSPRAERVPTALYADVVHVLTSMALGGRAEPRG